MSQKIKLALLAGGKSGERKVSLRGAAEVEKALDPNKYEVRRYDPACDMARLAADAPRLDAAFILLHGLMGEDGTVQGFLDLLGLPYQGAGVLGSALAMDKALSKTIYRDSGLPTPDWRMARGSNDDHSLLIKELGLPLVVKPLRQGSSIGMSIVQQAADLKAALGLAFRHDREVMVEQYFQGREITVGVLGNDELQALPLVEIIPGREFAFFDYQAKYQAGASREVCPAELSPEITSQAQEYALRAHKALKLRGYSRTDMIVNQKGIFLLETNTIPGMTPTSLLPRAAAAAGLPFPALLDRLIELALQETGGRKQETD
ncbi:D-alanine--D-alanine ligase family protein [Desulfobacterota bacterium M19]